jgi:hypothetical protein
MLIFIFGMDRAKLVFWQPKPLLAVGTRECWRKRSGQSRCSLRPLTHASVDRASRPNRLEITLSLVFLLLFYSSLSKFMSEKQVGKLSLVLRDLLLQVVAKIWSVHGHTITV